MKTVMSELQSLWNSGHAYPTDDLLSNHMPHGIGFDTGVSLVSLTPDKVVFEAPFHHTNEHGMYDGWVTYIVTVRSTFNGNDVTVSVKGYDNTARKYADSMMRDYVAETFAWHLFDKTIGE